MAGRLIKVEKQKEKEQQLLLFLLFIVLLQFFHGLDIFLTGGKLHFQKVEETLDVIVEEAHDISVADQRVIAVFIHTDLEVCAVQLVVKIHDLAEELQHILSGHKGSFDLISFFLHLLPETFLICLAGLHLGKKIGVRISSKASILGGVILIAIGIEIMLSSIL